MRQFWLALPVAAATATGLDLAGIDRSVAPGDDFFRHANGTWLATTEIPADRAELRAGSDPGRADHPADGRADSAGGKVRRHGRVGGPRVGDYYASFMDEAASTAKGLAPLQPALDRIAAIADRARPRARARARRCAPTSTSLNATNLDTDNLLGLWVAQDLDDPTRYAAVPPAGRARHARPRVLPRRLAAHGGDPRRSSRRTSPRARAGAASPTPRRGAARIADARAPDRRGARDPREDSVDVAQGQQPLVARAASTAARPASTGRRSSRPPASAQQAEFVVWQPARGHGPRRRSSASEPLETWKDYLSFHALEHARRRAARRLRRRALRVPRHRARRHAAASRRAGSAAVDVTNDALGDAVGQLYVERYFPPDGEGAASRRMVKNLHHGLRRRIDAPRLDGAGHQGAGQGEAGRAQGRHRLSRPLARLLRRCASCAATPSATPSGPRRFELRAQPRQARPRPVDRSEWVDDAADGQRGEPAGHERAQLPGRPSCSRPTSTRSARPRMNYGAIGADHRPRDQPQLRRPGRAVRRRAAGCRNWWTRRRPRALRGGRRRGS